MSFGARLRFIAGEVVVLESKEKFYEFCNRCNNFPQSGSHLRG